ncbi:MAG: hypothetical protein ACFFG0_41690 [Candidatus Thorarchaeota archaeon]
MFLPIGAKKQWNDPYTIPREIKVRKNHDCSHCTKEIKKGSIAVVCYSEAFLNNPFKPIKEKQYLHPECFNAFKGYNHIF